jgi:hypothetical protein
MPEFNHFALLSMLATWEMLAVICCLFICIALQLADPSLEGDCHD